MCLTQETHSGGERESNGVIYTHKIALKEGEKEEEGVGQMELHCWELAAFTFVRVAFGGNITEP